MARPLQSLRLRQATVAFLRSDSDLITAGEPDVSNRIYGRRVPPAPTWPFLRVNVALEGPLRKGTIVRVTVHTFSKAQFDDEAETLNAIVQRALEDKVLELGPGTKAFMAWLSSQVLPDGAEADAYHGINSFDATIG